MLCMLTDIHRILTLNKFAETLDPDLCSNIYIRENMEQMLHIVESTTGIYRLQSHKRTRSVTLGTCSFMLRGEAPI